MQTVEHQAACELKVVGNLEVGKKRIFFWGGGTICGFFACSSGFVMTVVMEFAVKMSTCRRFHIDATREAKEVLVFDTWTVDAPLQVYVRSCNTDFTIIDFRPP